MRERDVRAVLSLLDGAAAAQSVLDYGRFLAEHTHRLLDGDLTGLNFIDVRNSKLPYIEMTPGSRAPHKDPQLYEAFERHIPEHPLINYFQRTGDGRAVRLSDFLSDREFHELGLYRECFRHAGIERQIAISLEAEGDIIVGIAVTRDHHRDFDSDDVAIFDLLRPNLRTAFRNARRLERLAEFEALEDDLHKTGRGLLRLDARLRVRFATLGTQEWLAEFFGRAPSGSLPGAVEEWVRAGEPPTLRAARGPRRIAVEAIISNGGKVLTVSVRDVNDLDRALRELGLTLRERHVALHLCDGLQDAQIADALGLSVRTVHKHLEHVYGKLGVSTRTAAATAITKLLRRE